MDENGNWSLSPFYDVTFAFNPNGMWTSKHQISILGYSDNKDITEDVLLKIGKEVGLLEKFCKEVIEKTYFILKNFKTYMKKAEVSEERIEKMFKEIRKKEGIKIEKNRKVFKR